MTEEVKKIYEQYRSKQTYYDILGVTPNASFQSIYNARDREVRMSWNRPNDLERINEAYRVLSNPITRREYDALLKEAVQAIEQPVQNVEVESTPEVVESTPEVVESTPEVVESTPEVVESTPEVVESTPEVVESTPEVVESTPEAVESTPEVVEPTPEVVEPTPEVVEPTPEVVEPTKQELDEKLIDAVKNDVDVAEIKKSNRKKIAKRVAIILGSTILFGPIGTVVSSILTKKSGKFKLQKVAKTGILKEVKTSESKLITTANQELEREITELLNKPLKSGQDNYKLELARKRYQNNVDLLSERIKHRRSQIDELGMKAHNRLQLLALTTSLKLSIGWLELMKTKEEKKKALLDRYSPLEVDDKLADLNEEIEELREEISNEDTKQNVKNRKGIKLRKLNTKKLALINKMQLKKNGISRWQVVKAIFGNKNPKITEENVEALEEQTSKTR